ncbi:MAG: SEFIR domain-containing protein [Bacteroidia bacterium]
MSQIKKIFISYSHDNDAHREAVLRLATQLMEWGGLDVILDQWETSPEEGWTLWMEKSIRDADYCLVVSTSLYYEKVMHDIKEGGDGAKWEGRIMRNLLYGSGSSSKKFVPILLGKAKPLHILTALRDATYYRADETEDFEKLYRYLTAQPASVRPPVKPAVKELPSQKPAVKQPEWITESLPLPWEKKDDPKALIANGKLDEAISLMLESAEGDEATDLIMLQGQLNSLKKKERAQIIANDDATLERNQIAYAVLGMLTDDGQ